MWHILVCFELCHLITNSSILFRTPCYTLNITLGPYDTYNRNVVSGFPPKLGNRKKGARTYIFGNKKPPRTSRYNSLAPAINRSSGLNTWPSGGKKDRCRPLQQ